MYDTLHDQIPNVRVCEPPKILIKFGLWCDVKITPQIHINLTILNKFGKTEV